MSATARLAALAAALLAVTGFLPAVSARADGDPASDVLVAEDVFLPYTPPVSAALTAAVNETVRRAHAAGFPIKVAVIESPIDLGADPELFGGPGRYARFLDTEITYNSAPPLLVVMPQGFGTVGTAPAAALARIHIDTGAGSDGLARGAIAAIVALAARGGRRISAPADLGAGGTVPLWPIIAAAAVIVVGLLGATRTRLRRRRRR